MNSTGLCSCQTGVTRGLLKSPITLIASAINVLLHIQNVCRQTAALRYNKEFRNLILL